MDIITPISPIDGPVLTTDRLVLRAPTAADYPGFKALIMSDRGKFIGGPLNDEGRAWRAFASIIGHWHLIGFGVFAITEASSGESMGLCGHWFPEGTPEIGIGWNVFEGFEGKGIAFEAASAVITYSFETMALPTLVSYINPKNHRSVALAKRLGAILDENAAAPDTTSAVYRHSAR